MDKVILIYPQTGWDIKGVSISLPLSLLYLANPLDKGNLKVKIIDQRVNKRDWENILSRELKDKPICVGISSMTGFQIKGGLKASQIVKRLSPQTKVVWGGVHPSLLPEQTLKNNYIDLVVRGEGEETFLRLVEAISNNHPLEEIKGLSFKKDNQVIHNPPREFIDLNKLPPLPYHLIRLKDYFTHQTLGEEDLILSTSRGCPHNCSYCYNVSFNQKRWRAESASKIIENIQYLAEKHNIHSFHINEDNFFVDLGRVKELCQLIKEKRLKINIKTSCKIEYIVKYDLSFLQLLKEVGFVQLIIGIESGSEKILKQLNKEVGVEQILKVNQKLKRAKVATTYDFMGGFPQEEKEDLKGTIHLMLRLLKENELARTSAIRLYTPYPGTQLYNFCKERGWSPPTSLLEWSSFDWNQINFPWLSKYEKKKLENMSYATFFLDKKTIGEYYAHNLLMNLISKFYASLVRYRCKHNLWRFMPEIGVLKRLKKVIA